MAKNKPHTTEVDDGIPAELKQSIIDVLSAHPHVEEIYLTGERARGEHHAQSDIQLLLKGEKLTESDLDELREKLEGVECEWYIDIQRSRARLFNENMLLLTVKVDGQVQDAQFDKISEFIDINPKRTVKKGTNSKYVSMQCLAENQREITAIEKREFKGSGSKFQNGDTLLARITPCLENGKTAFVDNLSANEIAHGSTEFIVMSSIENKSDNKFIYYLARSPRFRAYAIARMEGSSGRQRVPASTLNAYRFKFPSLKDQRAIAHILGSLDDKIELNRKINKTLEEMAQAIFKSWFIDFDPVVWKAVQAGKDVPEQFHKAAQRYREQPERMTLNAETLDLFPDEFVESELGWVPRGWEVKKLGTIFQLRYGKSLKRSSRVNGPFPVYGSGGITGYHNTFLSEGPGVIVGRKGTVGSLYWEDKPFYPIDTVFYVDVSNPQQLPWIYYTLQTIDIKSLAADSAVPGVNRHFILGQKSASPSSQILNKFFTIVNTIRKNINSQSKTSEDLVILRDTLLPKLISGELRIQDVDKVLENAL